MNQKTIIGIVGGLILVALLGVGGFLFIYQPNQEEGYYTQAESAREAGDYQTAIDNYNRALSILPDSARSYDQATYEGRALAHFGDGNWQAALDDLNQVDGVEQDITLLETRAQAYAELGNLENAINDWSLLLESNDQPTLREQRAFAYLTLGNAASAQADFEQLLANGELSAEASIALFELVQANGNDEAIEALSTTLINADTPLVEAFLTRGTLHLQAGRTVEALADFGQAMALEPENVTAVTHASLTLLYIDTPQAQAMSQQVAGDPLADAILASLAVQEGDVAALLSLNEAVAQAETAVYPFTLALRAQALISMGELDAALTDAEQLLAEAPNLYWGYWIRGQINVAREANPQALFDFEQALTFAPEATLVLADQAQAYYQSGDIPAALADLATALNDYPEYEPALLLQAQAHIANADTEAALTSLDELLSVHPNNIIGTQLRANIQFDMSNWEAAQADYSTVLTFNPTDVPSLQRRAEIALELGEYETAVADLTLALREDPQIAELYALRIQAYLATNEREAALQDAQRALTLDDDLAIAYLAIGLDQLAQESYFEAIVTLSDAIDEDETLAPAYAARAEAYFWQNDPDRARADANRALELDAELAEAYLARALVFAYEREWADALADADRAVDLAPDNAVIVASRGRIYFDGGDYNEALDDFNQAITLEPEVARWHLFKADALNELQRFDEAVDTLAEAIQLAQIDSKEITLIESAESLTADIARIPPAQDGFRTWRDPYHKFSISYPEEWSQFVDPGFSAPLALIGPLDKDYRANLFVLVIEDISLTTGQLSRAFDPPSTLPNFEELSNRTVTVGNRTGIRKLFSWTDSDDRLRDVPVTVIQVYVLSQGRALIFTATMRSEDVEKYEPIFDAMIASFVFE